MSLNWLVAPQIHKATNGYFLNHDNLMLANKEQRNKLIFYYIANQTPEKLTPEDHAKFNEEKLVDLDFRAYTFTAFSTAFALWQVTENRFVSTRISGKPFFNTFLIAATGLLTLSFSYNLGQVLFEPQFVSRNTVIDELAQKYKFSIFDFALAKKEAHLKALRNELTSDSANPSHF